MSEDRSSAVPKSEGEDAAGVSIRLLRRTAEFTSCVEAQRRIWGEGFGDVVPVGLFQISAKIGGVIAAAFGNDGSGLVGFVYGLTGVRAGRLSHWSHMLGVVPECRGQGIGQKLKQFQRGRVRDMGVEEIMWSFDPLIAGNAHFNLNLLGVKIASYTPRMYAETGSALHSFGTDRFVARWDLTRVEGDGSVAVASARPHAAREALLANVVPGVEAMVPCDVWDPAARRVRVEIPDNILAIHQNDPQLALAWRHSTRVAFRRCFRAGYRVTEFTRVAGNRRCVYILERE